MLATDDDRLVLSMVARVRESLCSTVLPAYLEPREAAQYLSVSHRTLERWRRDSFGPPFSAFDRAIRYRVIDLDDWMRERRAR